MVYGLVSYGINYFVTNTHLLDKLVWVKRSLEELSFITSALTGVARKSPIDVACALQMLKGYVVGKKVSRIILNTF